MRTRRRRSKVSKGVLRILGGEHLLRLGAFGQVKGEHTSERLLSDVSLQAVKLTGLQGILGKVQPLDEAHKERADCRFEVALCRVSGV
jgi:hypothetical protein